MFEISPYQPDDSSDVKIEHLLDRAFGADRLEKSSYSYRQDVEDIKSLAHVAHSDGEIVATIRYWPIQIGVSAVSALLLGPVAVEPARRGEGIGIALIRISLVKARQSGFGVVALVGDLPYYQRFAFAPASQFNIHMRDEDDRLLVRELNRGVLRQASGDVSVVRQSTSADM